MYALLLLSNSKVKMPEISADKVKHTLEIMIEKSMINSVLDSIANRESGFNYMGNKSYSLVSPTNDYGKYQLNGIHWNYGGVCQGITYTTFLNNPELQEIKARELMALHIRILRSKGIKITTRKLHLSWFGIGVALYNN